MLGGLAIGLYFPVANFLSQSTR